MLTNIPQKDKQTKKFKMGDITFFKIDKKGNLRHRCLPCDAHDDQIAAADGATMKLDNKKNGWKQTQLPCLSSWAPIPLHMCKHGAKTLHIFLVETSLMSSDNISQALKHTHSLRRGVAKPRPLITISTTAWPFQP
jgi:hypothetical protein